jgi:cell division protein FtsB
MKASQTKRRKDPAFWNALNRVLVLLIATLIVVGVVLWFSPELIRRKAMSKNLDLQKSELAAQQLLLEKREREVFLLENDTFYIETIARDKLDLMKEGETIFRLDSLPPPQPSPEKK